MKMTPGAISLWNRRSKQQLLRLAKNIGLPISGTKADLAERIDEHHQKQFTANWKAISGE